MARNRRVADELNSFPFEGNASMKARILAAMGVLALVISVAVYAEEEKKDLSKIKCPVSGQAVKADKTKEYKDGVVYFCCDNCPKSFDAAKHGTKANAQLVATGQAKQEKCPLSGGKLNPDTKISVAGADVAFCCNMCKGKVAAAKGDEQLALVFSDKAFEKAGFKVAKKKEE